MADDPKNTPAGGTDGGKPADSGAKPAASAFELPAELKGKGPEDVARYYSDRYKDYDDFKTKASAAEPWTKLNRKPEEVQGALTSFDRIREALRQGKVIVNENGQMFAKDRSELTPAQKREVQQQDAQSGQGQDWLDGYDLLEPTAQARRLEKHFSGRLEETVKAKEEQYGQVLNQYRTEAYSLVDKALTLIAACQDNPSLKIRDVLVRAGQITGSSDPIKDAIAELLEPSRIESRAQQMAAERMAEQKAKDEKAAAERRIGGTETAGARSPLMEALRSGANGSRTSREEILSNIREKFGT